jgi:Cu+-exporting ATPase
MAHKTLNLPIGGMTCGNCARAVERKLASTPGVARVSVNLEGASAAVDYDADLVQPEALAAAVRKLGYEVPA